MDRLGKYRITGELGRGSMGVVLAAEDPQLQRAVAIKILELEAGNQQEALQRFLREARSAAKLNHPNVVMIHEINEEGGRPYLVTELLTGGSLQEAIEQQPGLPWREATRAIADACRGLVAAHEAGLVHRDIKPANLLRSATNTVKIADFGLAKSPHEGTLLTAAGTVFGTPHYMSPEQWGSEPLTELTDVWSLGGTYYSLLTGEPPFGNRTPLQIMYACCSGPTPDPREKHPDLPERCSLIINKAMAKELGNRYQSALEMLIDLDELLHDPSLPGAGPITARMAKSPTVRTHRRSLLMDTWKGLIRRRSLLLMVLGILTGMVLLAGVGWWYATGDPSNWLRGEGRDWRSAVSQSGGRWTVERGELIGTGPGGVLQTIRSDFANFELKLEVYLEKGWGSLWVRTALQDGKRRGYRFQLAPGDFGGLERVLDKQPRGLFSHGLDVGPGVWDSLVLTVQGHRLKMQGTDRLISEVTEEYDASESDIPRRGEIVLIAEDSETRIRIRRFELRELP